jgi:glycosyltransferase involved in cell wall biosynthesis
MQYPLVSCMVTCYNQARFVTECLEAVKAQNYPNLELIVNDDASQDDSVAVIEEWLGKNGIPHLFLKSATNQGICRSVNNVLRRTHGKYISGIAADDVWLPGKLRTQVEMLEALPPKVGVVYSDALQMDQQGRLLPLRFMEADGRSFGSGVVPQGNIHLALWQGNNFIAPMTTLTRRECFDRVGLYDESLFAEDWDMWLRLSRHYEFAYSPEVSAKYRVVGTSATRLSFGRLVDDMCRVCLKHLASGELEPAARRAASMKLYALASCSSYQQSRRHKHNLLQALRYRPCAGSLARCLLAWCNLGPTTLDRISAVLGRSASQPNRRTESPQPTTPAN